jgi:hypothetical protein
MALKQGANRYPVAPTTQAHHLDEIVKGNAHSTGNQHIVAETKFIIKREGRDIANTEESLVRRKRGPSLIHKFMEVYVGIYAVRKWRSQWYLELK